MKKIFTEHLQEREVTYFQHLNHALGYAVTLAICSAALVLHAFFPFVFETYASDRVERK
tara:strand:+ start:574 stop:750 length:177 start_codon:yes stop_codon:yes gene_type:complete